MTDRCDACGFVYDLTTARQAALAITLGAEQVGTIIERGDAILRRRPAPDTWSSLEYACHLRDVLLVQRERVLLARRTEQPPLVPMGRDERVEHDGYNEQSPSAVARQLRDAAGLFAGVLDRLDDDDWGRTVIYNFPEPSVRDLRWLAVHTHHEVQHHLADIRAQINDDTED
jgi:DinB superfamily